MSIRVNEINIRANLTPGNASFDNFKEVKSYLENGLSVYNNTVYSIDNAQQARNDLAVLKVVKNKLVKYRKNLVDAYQMPIEVVVEQLDELIGMVKEPYDIIDRMLKSNEKEIKRRDIMGYAGAHAEALGLYKDKVIFSPAFFNYRWLNKTYKDTEWKKDVDSIINRAIGDIAAVKALGRDNTGALLGFYFDKLSLDGVEEFLKTLDESKVEQINVDADTGEIIEDIGTEQIIRDFNMSERKISRIVKLTGTTENINRFIESAVLCNVEIEEVQEKTSKEIEDHTTDTDFNTGVSSDNDASNTVVVGDLNFAGSDTLKIIQSCHNCRFKDVEGKCGHPISMQACEDWEYKSEIDRTAYDELNKAKEKHGHDTNPDGWTSGYFRPDN